MEAGWSAKSVARQLCRSDCFVRRCWNQRIREMSFTRRPNSGRPRQISRREERHILRPILVLPLTPTHQRLRLEWRRAPGNWTAAEWNQIVFSDKSRFNLSSDGNHVRVWRPRGDRLNPSLALQRLTPPTAGVMV
ncbi:transposable element Tcb2 transposase [Trichonephila clavipes]|nr:transposable element Tcb2 transposase [Trichonephila clavipes]